MPGMKSLKIRKKLIENMSMSYYFWIGANDIALERNWMWVNDERARRSELHWDGNEGFFTNHDSDCVLVDGFPTSSNVGKAFDDPCGYSYKGLCEKEI